MEKPREVPLFRALNRPHLLFGCDREAVILLAVLAGILVFLIQTKLAFVVGLTTWFVGLIALRLMAKYDPHLRKVAVRHINYRKLYLGGASGLRRLMKDEVRQAMRWR